MMVNMKYCIEFKIFFLKKNIKISKNINKMMTNTILLSSVIFDDPVQHIYFLTH